MLVDLSAEAINTCSSVGLPSWVRYDAGGLRVAGDNSLSRETYLFTASDGVILTTDLPEMMDALRDRGAVRVSGAGVSHVLGSGFTPVPSTIFDSVLRLGAGDEALVAFGPQGASVETRFEYPWLLANSRQDEVPSTDRLYELIVRSLEEKLDASGRQGLLMLSSGKDSVALAIALADLGYDVPCATYRSSRENTEHEHAAAICRKLGLRHQTVEMPTDRAAIRRIMTSFFERTVAPSADHAAIPLLATVDASGVSAGGLIAGDGNDGYMGYIASKRRRKKRAFRVRGRWLQAFVARNTRIDSRMNYLARGRSAIAWPGRNMRIHEIMPIYADAVDPALRWRQEDARLAGRSDSDRAAANMLRQIEGARVANKVRLVAQARDMRAVFPYCEPAIAEYYFHLPVEHRYLRKGHKEKVLLRRMLEERIGYDAAAIGDGFFEFDGAPFFVNNADFVRSEILSCTLWEQPVAKVVDEWLDALPNRPFLFHPLLSLFMVSGWHNHSTYLSA